MSRDPARNIQQAHALYRWHQQGSGSIERTARRLNVSPRAVYAMTENQITCPACVLGPLWDLYGDESLINDLIGPTERPGAWVALPGAGSSHEDVHALCSFTSKAGEVISSAAKALADGKLDESERGELLPQLDELQRKIESLKAALRSKP